MATAEERYAQDIERAREEGLASGIKQGRQEILDWLEQKYIGPNAPERTSYKAKAILQLARDAAKHLRELS